MIVACSTVRMYHYKWFVLLVKILSNQKLGLKPDMVYKLTHLLKLVQATLLLLTAQVLLTVTDTINGCGDSDVVTVIDLRVNPTVAFSSAVFPCNVDTFNIQGVVSPASVNYAYSWTGDGILGAADGVNVSLDTSGIFVLNVLDTINQCSVVDTIEVLDQICLNTCAIIALLNLPLFFHNSHDLLTIFLDY